MNIDQSTASPSAAAVAAKSDEQLYEQVRRIHPRSVKGMFRNIKWILMSVLLAVFHLGPFLRWHRGEGAPDQAILIDMGARRAYFFFIEIWPQEVYYLTGLLLFAGLALFTMSALAGRVWCGFLCFQTVYTDLFVAVERLIIGERGRRIAMDRRKWDFEKAWRKSAVVAVWAIISLIVGISFVLYFDDAYTLLPQIFTGDAGVGIYTFLAIVGGGCFLCAGWGREQICIYMCPYSRFQAAMFDEHSLVVAYEAWRGESRGPIRKGESFEGRGHCIDCKACVTVCPTGIDIREGNQLACIGCGLCIDACNTIMDRFNLPRGLISYDSAYNLEAKAAGRPPKVVPIRPRTIIYFAMLSVVASIMVYGLMNRSTTEVTILHERSPLYVMLGSGDIRNGYTYKVLNKVRLDRHFTLDVQGIEGASLTVVGDDDAKGKPNLDVDGDLVGTFRIYVTAPYDKIKGKATPFTFVLTDRDSGAVERREGTFMGPDKD
jgi:cytochrome c oxidase accessory protein FixG